MINRRKSGSYFEQKALLYLAKRGFKLIECNYHAKRESELDLIMFDGAFIVFVEVKSLRDGNGFSLYETITKKKKRYLKKGILSWLLKHNHINSPWRLDFIGIMYQNLEKYKVIYIPFVEL